MLIIRKQNRLLAIAVRTRVIADLLMSYRVEGKGARSFPIGGTAQGGSRQGGSRLRRTNCRAQEYQSNVGTLISMVISTKHTPGVVDHVRVPGCMLTFRKYPHSAHKYRLNSKTRVINCLLLSYSQSTSKLPHRMARTLAPQRTPSSGHSGCEQRPRTVTDSRKLQKPTNQRRIGEIPRQPGKL